MTDVNFSRVKDSQLSAYVQSLEAAQGMQAIGAKPAELAELPPDELDDRLQKAKAELQARAIAPEPPLPPPSVVNGWRFASGYPQRSQTARGLWDVRIVKGKVARDFFSLSLVDEAKTLRWAAEQAAAHEAEPAGGVAEEEVQR